MLPTLDSKEAAEMLGISRPALWKRVQRNWKGLRKITYGPGKRLLFFRDELKQWASKAGFLPLDGEAL